MKGPSIVEDKQLAVIGDKVVCSCQGGPHKIVSGAPTADLYGVPIAKVGDKSSCGATIVSGTNKYRIRGVDAAIDGSETSCGGRVVATK